MMPQMSVVNGVNGSVNTSNRVTSGSGAGEDSLAVIQQIHNDSICLSRNIMNSGKLENIKIDKTKLDILGLK